MTCTQIWLCLENPNSNSDLNFRQICIQTLMCTFLGIYYCIKTVSHVYLLFTLTYIIAIEGNWVISLIWSITWSGSIDLNPDSVIYQAQIFYFWGWSFWATGEVGPLPSLIIMLHFLEPRTSIVNFRKLFCFITIQKLNKRRSHSLEFLFFIWATLLIYFFQSTFSWHNFVFWKKSNEDYLLPLEFKKKKKIRAIFLSFFFLLKKWTMNITFSVTT